MKPTSPLLAAALACLFVLPASHAEGPYRNADSKNPNDVGEGSYPVPYQMPTVAAITATLHRVSGYLDSVTPTRIVSRKSGAPIADLKTPVADAIFEPSKGDFGIMVYEMGVVHAGLLRAAEATGDRSFLAMTERHFNFFKESKPYFAAQEKQFKLERGNSFARFLDPRSLDDSGSMCAALMRARAARVGPDLSDMIATCGDWVAHKQYRLPDGSFGRQRPQAQSLWGDDMYMGVPALAEMGRMTGQRVYFDDAVNNVRNMSARLFNPQTALYTHGWHAGMQDAPNFYWARANGWAVLAMSDVLDVLPPGHPGYPKVLAQLRLALKGIAERQSGSGLWHQMLDRDDSYLETSASAIFTYVIAHAVDQGWISPAPYGSIAQAGWAGLQTRITAKGEVEGTCVGTTLAGDQVYYYNRPTSKDALHGYGPLLLAGAEMIKLVTNPKLDIQYRLRTYHYLPKGGATDYREQP